jgi:site-specific DNA recombinase
MIQFASMIKTTIDPQVLRDISAGKYREQYLVYNRKSTDDTENQKNSIKYQKSENIRFAFREHLLIAPLTLDGFATDGIVSERHSGFKESFGLVFGKDNTVQYRVDRPKFHRLVQMLSKGYFKGVIILCWDRASRNRGDDTILRKLMKAGVDIRFTLAQYDKTSAGELHMDIDGMFAEHHSRVTREKVMLTIRNSRARGLCTNKAPVGYLNNGSMESKPFDPSRAPIIKHLFELAATGDWSLADLARWAIEQGFTMTPMRRRRTEEEILAEEEDDARLEIDSICRLPTFKNVHRILSNPFYAGKTWGSEGTWIRSVSHEALVTEELFNQVQDQMQKRNRSVHYTRLLSYPLRGIVRCAVCGRVYTPYIQKRNIYYGARCDRNCVNQTKSFNFDFIVDKIASLIERLSFTDEEIAEIDARASTDVALLDTRRINQLEIDERKKKRIREDLAYLNANTLMLLRTGAYTAETLAAEEARLNLDLASLRDAEDASDISMEETVKDLIKLSELLKDGLVYYCNAKPREKDQIIRVIFSELTLSGNVLEYKCKNGFEPLATRFVSPCDPTGWLSELIRYHQSMSDSADELRCVIDSKAMAA